MYCSKCGSDNADDAVYCKKCGTLIEAEEETRVVAKTARAIADIGEHQRIFSIAPTLKFVFIGYLAIVFVAFALVILLTALIPGFIPFIGVIIGFFLLLIPVYYHVKQKMIRYSLTDNTIEIDRGLISRSTQNIPLRRIQDVTVTSTLFQRMMGYGDITIDNASEDGGKVVLDNVDQPRKYADLILREMRQLDR